jgi:LysR family transcriptional regulator, regulator for metE and metH
MILEVKHLQLVEAVAAYGSLTNAGKHLHLTQSALSHQLVELERRLGTPLFYRVGRRLVPTLAGDRLLRSATQTLTILRRTESSLKRIAAGHEVVLRFSTACYTTYHWLSPLLDEYARRCPTVDVEVVAEATRRPVEALLAGKIDVGIVSNVRADERLEIVPLFDDELVLIMPPRHPLAARAYVTAQDLANEHLLVYTEPRADNSIFQRVLDPAGVVPRRVSAIQLTEAIVEMVKAGLGVAALAQWAVEPHVRAGGLVGVRVTPHGLHRTWQAAMVRQPATPLYVREFCRLLAAGPAGLAAAPGGAVARHAAN